MQRLIFLVTFILLFTLLGKGQQSISDSIIVQKSFGGYNFSQGGKKLTVKQLVGSMKLYEPAYLTIKSSQRNYYGGIVAGCIGGFIIGWQIGYSMDGSSPKWGMIALGSGIALTAIPFTIKAFKKALKATEIYNGSIRKVTFRLQCRPEMGLCLNGNGLGMIVRF
jgi:hypothetical protein